MSINFRELRERVRIEEVLCWMSWEATSRRGDQLRGRCPFCAAPEDVSSDQSTSSVYRVFSVNTNRNIYRCFKCQASGNALDLWSSYHRLPLYTAAQEIECRLAQNWHPKKHT